jgi:hypothetical protein
MRGKPQRRALVMRRNRAVTRGFAARCRLLSGVENDHSDERRNQNPTPDHDVSHLCSPPVDLLQSLATQRWLFGYRYYISDTPSSLALEWYSAPRCRAICRILAGTRVVVGNGAFTVNRRSDRTPVGAATHCIYAHKARNSWSVFDAGSQIYFQMVAVD